MTNRPGGNPEYAAFVSHAVAVQEARKASLEARGVATITASGALATVLLGIVTLTKSAHGTFVLPEPSRGWLQGALAAFAVSAALAIATNVPVPLGWADPDELTKLVDASWNDEEAESQTTIADHEIARLRPLTKWNDVKGYALIAAMVCQGAAIALVAVAVWKAL